jgi:hypothetical protein
MAGPFAGLPARHGNCLRRCKVLCVTFKVPSPWWPAACKPVSIVELNEKCLGLRVVCASGERMTVPLGQATFEMLWPK